MAGEGSIAFGHRFAGGEPRKPAIAHTPSLTIVIKITQKSWGTAIERKEMQSAAYPARLSRHRQTYVFPVFVIARGKSAGFHQMRFELFLLSNAAVSTLCHPRTISRSLLGRSFDGNRQINRATEGNRRSLARPEGFEPPTNGFGSHYSIRLSYGRVVEPPRHRPVPGRASQRHEAVRDRHSIQFRRTNLPPRAKPCRRGRSILSPWLIPPSLRRSRRRRRVGGITGV